MSLREKKRKKDMKSASCVDCDEVTIGPSISLFFFDVSIFAPYPTVDA